MGTATRSRPLLLFNVVTPATMLPTLILSRCFPLREHRTATRQCLLLASHILCYLVQPLGPLLRNLTPTPLEVLPLRVQTTFPGPPFKLPNRGKHVYLVLHNAGLRCALFLTWRNTVSRGGSACLNILEKPFKLPRSVKLCIPMPLLNLSEANGIEKSYNALEGPQSVMVCIPLCPRLTLPISIQFLPLRRVIHVRNFNGLRPSVTNLPPASNRSEELGRPLRP